MATGKFAEGGVNCAPDRYGPLTRCSEIALSQLVSLSGSHTTWLTPFFFISPRTVSGLSAITGASFIHYLRQETFRLPLLACDGKAMGGATAPLIETPRAAAGYGEIQEQKAVEHGQLAVVENGKKAPRRVRHEIRKCHFA